MDENYMVTKANELIMSNYDLSLEEQRIILTLASLVQPSDTELKSYTFRIREFVEMLEIKDKSKYTSIPKITKDLMKKVFEIHYPDGSILQAAWLSSAFYKASSGCVELKFSQYLKPYLLGLKELYTSYKLNNILSLKSKYSIRMYEILKSSEFKKIFIIELDSMKKLIGACEKSYQVYSNFKNRVLLSSISEINSVTDLFVTYKEVKQGRKVNSLEFYIAQNKKKNLVAQDQLSNNGTNIDTIYQYAKNIISSKITRDLIKELLSDYGEEKVNFYLQNWDKFSTKTLNNKIGFFTECIRKGYNLPEQQTGNPVKPIQATNYKQREYDDEYYESLYDNL